MKRPSGERFFGLEYLASRFRTTVQRRRGKGIQDQHPSHRLVEPGQPNQFMQAMITYLADRQRLRQQGHFHERYGELSNIALVDAYHNDLTALASNSTADAYTAQSVREAGNVSGVRDHFELFAFARLNPQKQVEIVTRKARELEQHEGERSSQAQDKVWYTGEELATVALLLERIGFRFDYPGNGYELTRSELDAAWKTVIGKWQEQVIKATKDRKG